MKKEVICSECNKSTVLEFPDVFEGMKMETYEQTRSYIHFLELCKIDYSYGKFCRSEDKEVWLCPECNQKTVWYANEKVA